MSYEKRDLFWSGMQEKVMLVDNGWGGDEMRGDWGRDSGFSCKRAIVRWSP